MKPGKYELKPWKSFYNAVVKGSVYRVLMDKLNPR